jgi:hypothetical protein
MDKSVIICDLDGTLADQTHRQHFITKPLTMPIIGQAPWKPDWDTYYRACPADAPMETNIRVVQALLASSPGLRLIITTGRSAAVRDETVQWLNTHLDQWDGLVMRPVGNYTPDHELKKTWCQDGQACRINQVLCAFEDRDRTVRMYRELGITCYQVAAGDF